MNDYNTQKQASSRRKLPILIFFAIILAMEFPIVDIPKIIHVREAQAVVGRPATPGSVAGVHRLTRRRTVRRVAVGTRLTVLPVGYQTVKVKGATYHVHEDVYYCPVLDGDKIVYIVCEPPK